MQFEKICNKFLVLFIEIIILTLIDNPQMIVDARSINAIEEDYAEIGLSMMEDEIKDRNFLIISKRDTKDNLRAKREIKPNDENDDEIDLESPSDARRKRSPAAAENNKDIFWRKGIDIFNNKYEFEDSNTINNGNKRNKREADVGDYESGGLQNLSTMTGDNANVDKILDNVSNVIGRAFGSIFGRSIINESELQEKMKSQNVMVVDDGNIAAIFRTV